MREVRGALSCFSGWPLASTASSWLLHLSRGTVPDAVCREAVFRVVLIALLVFAAPLCAMPADENNARGLLARMSVALRTNDYQGSFVYERNGQIDALRLFHEGGSTERERLISMNGPRSEIVRSGGSIISTQTDAPTVFLNTSDNARLLPLTPDTRGAFFSKYYALNVAGQDRIAGYGARVVTISPRDAYRYGYRLWLDESTSLPLRSELVDSARRTLEQFMFVALDIGAKPKESDLQSNVDSGISAPPEELPLTTPPRWRVADLPPGFHFLRGLRPAQGPTQTEHDLYTDGIANISVYIEPRDSSVAAAAERSMARGALNVYSRDLDAWRITALGDVPHAAVERIARSTQAVNAQPR